MTGGLKLIVAVLTFRMPPRLLLYAIRNRMNRRLQTGNRRFEFEKSYLEHVDPWNYRFSPYELEKYQRTLGTVLLARATDKNVLEVGCSIGVFTKMLSENFEQVTAIDISREAIKSAAAHNREKKNIRFVHGDLRSLHFVEQYAVIVCAEVLYYVAERDAPTVREQLDRYLADNGIIVIVTSFRKPQHNFFYFDAWEEILAPKFKNVSKEIVQDPVRPYEVVVLARHRS